eukprot:1890469-Pyramimonas_sp.AAC.1
MGVALKAPAVNCQRHVAHIQTPRTVVIKIGHRVNTRCVLAFLGKRRHQHDRIINIKHVVRSYPCGWLRSV